MCVPQTRGLCSSIYLHAASSVTLCLTCGFPQVMVNNLSRLTGTAVAVVGMAHLEGIERLWEARQAQHSAGADAAHAWQFREPHHPLGRKLSGL